MTLATENDFQKALNRAPTDWQSRLAFADWLRERDDPRADGFQVMGRLRLMPSTYTHPDGAHCKPKSRKAKRWYWWADGNRSCDCLPEDWYALTNPSEYEAGISARIYRTRRKAEDAAALAFALLPQYRREELLAAEYDRSLSYWEKP